jgi:hypothetical protein
MGTHSAGGWKSFFPIAVAIKTPVAALALLAVSTVLLLTRLFFRFKVYPKPSNPGSPAPNPSLFPALIVPFCVYWAVAIHTNLNIGHRHMLPSYPPMFIFAAYCVFLPLSAPPGPLFVRFLVRTAAAAAAVGSLAALVFEVQPHWSTPIPFFNALVGGPGNGYKCVMSFAHCLFVTSCAGTSSTPRSTGARTCRASVRPFACESQHRLSVLIICRRLGEPYTGGRKGSRQGATGVLFELLRMGPPAVPRPF